MKHIVILGRENVGKSSLFNRLLGENKAMISSEPGTTRDTKNAVVHWQGDVFLLSDTAGLNISNETVLRGKIKKQVEMALSSADVIMCVVDSQSGVVAYDRDLAKLIHKSGKPYLLVVNKIDTSKKEELIDAFNSLGLGPGVGVSAKTGFGTGDLLDRLVDLSRDKNIQVVDSSEEVDGVELSPIRISLIGQPNVGKSSILNAILGEERVIVSELPNTTREPNDIEFMYNNRRIVLVDTAGLRRRIQRNTLDAVSMKRSLDAIQKSDIVMLVFDAAQPLSVQDQRLAGMVQEARKGVIMIINKWDLVEDKDPNTINEYEAVIHAELPFLKGIPFLFVSAKTGLRVNKMLDLALEIHSEMMREIKPKELERFLKFIVKKQKPRPARGAKRPRIYEISQAGTHPPFFIIRVGSKDTLHTSYLRFIENQLREQYGFMGASIKLSLHKGTS